MFGNLVVDGAHLRLDRRAVLALRFHQPDLLGDRLALVLEFLLRGLEGTPRLIAGQHFVDQFPMIPAASLQPRLNLVRLFPYHPYVQHVGRTFTDRRGGEKLRFQKPISRKHRDCGCYYMGYNVGMITTVKITSIGNSAGIILPKELLEKLRVSKGDTLTVTETPDGIGLNPYDENFATAMNLAEEIMREDRDVLRKLAQ